MVSTAEKTMPRRIAVFGAGQSGRAAVRLGNSLGIDADCFDEVEGKGSSQSVFGAEEVIKYDAFVFSPGFSSDHPWCVLCHQSDRPCYSELGFAALFWKGSLLGVTGTNGKTSLTMLLTEAFRQNGDAVTAAGNIGRPLSDVCVEYNGGAGMRAICEISSFQAELTLGLQLDGLVWTNFAEDHLDRHGSMEAYLEAKAGLIKCLKPEAPSVFGPSVPFRGSVRIGTETDLPKGLAADSVFGFSPQQENLKLARLLWRALELPGDVLLDAARQFKAPRHRLEKIDEWSGVEFWNDSKATNLHAVKSALYAFKDPVFWVGGGRSKGADLKIFAGELSGQIESAYLYGEVAPALAEALAEVGLKTAVFGSLKDAVTAACMDAQLARPASLLFSPGFSSFDQFSGFEERGESFVSAVLSLKQRGEAT